MNNRITTINEGDFEELVVGTEGEGDVDLDYLRYSSLDSTFIKDTY